MTLTIQFRLKSFCGVLCIIIVFKNTYNQLEKCFYRFFNKFSVELHFLVFYHEKNRIRRRMGTSACLQKAMQVYCNFRTVREILNSHATQELFSFNLDTRIAIECHQNNYKLCN
jgi:hypothetical protein